MHFQKQQNHEMFEALIIFICYGKYHLWLWILFWSDVNLSLFRDTEWQQKNNFL